MPWFNAVLSTINATPPWWLPPLMTGVFVLIAALITATVAFLSLRASDRRKLEREDRRQWDRDVQKAHVEIATAIDSARNALLNVNWREETPEQIRERLGAPNLPQSEADKYLGQLIDPLQEAWDAVVPHAQLLDLVAPVEVSGAAWKLIDALSAASRDAWGSAFTVPVRGWDWPNARAQELRKLKEELRTAVRVALRVSVLKSSSGRRKAGA